MEARIRPRLHVLSWRQQAAVHTSNWRGCVCQLITGCWLRVPNLLAGLNSNISSKRTACRVMPITIRLLVTSQHISADLYSYLPQVFHSRFCDLAKSPHTQETHRTLIRGIGYPKGKDTP